MKDIKAMKYCPYCMSTVEGDEVCPVCGKDRSDYEPQMHHIPPGTILDGKYVIGRVLGEGGFGITYLGKDTALDMKVAIKEYFPRDIVSRSMENTAVFTFRRDNNFERGKERFLKEARTIAKMNKQMVFVSVTDFINENDTAYIVMEYIEGTTLADMVKQRGGIPEDELFELIEPLFDALSEFHETGLIHRDISPDNIMIEKGKVRLLDFGCAKDISNQNETMTVTVKQDYAPIEQFSTSTPQGPWTDIYSLSATIYFCLVGKAPKRAFDRIETDDLELPSQLGVTISPEREQAIVRGLAISAKKRWQTVDEFKTALYSVSAGKYHDVQLAGLPPIHEEPEPKLTMNYIPKGDSNEVPDIPGIQTGKTAQTYQEVQLAGIPPIHEEPERKLPVQQKKKRGIAVIAASLGGVALIAVVLAVVFANSGGDIPVEPGTSAGMTAASSPAALGTIATTTAKTTTPATTAKTAPDVSAMVKARKAFIRTNLDDGTNLYYFDVFGAYKVNETLIKAFPYNGDPNQLFEIIPYDDTYYYVKCSYTDKYWNINRGGGDKEGKLQIYTFFDGGENMLFKFEKAPNGQWYIIDKEGFYLCVDDDCNIYADNYSSGKETSYFTFDLKYIY